MIKALLLLLIPMLSMANTTLSIGGSARSYPSLGGSVQSSLGYERLLWGIKESSNDITYGMIQTKLDLKSSLVINEYTLSTTLYPISFLGIGAARSEAFSNYTKFKEYNCDDIQCKGYLRRHYTFIKLALGYASYIFGGNYQYSLNNYSHKLDSTKQGLPEYEFGSIITTNKEKHIRRSYFLGKKVNKKLTLGLAHDSVHFLESDKEYQMNLLFSSIQRDKTKYTLGFGSLETYDLSPSLLIVFSMTHEILPSIALF